MTQKQNAIEWAEAIAKRKNETIDFQSMKLKEVEDYIVKNGKHAKAHFFEMANRSRDNYGGDDSCDPLR